MTDTYENAKLAILNEVLSFPTIRDKDWHEDRKPVPGSLVCMSCAPVSKWYLSWVVETKLHEHGFHEYLLESIEDQSLCWWNNVSINVYNPKRVREMPNWRWTDKQFSFVSKWNRVLKSEDAYNVLPAGTTFYEDSNSVTIALRERWGGLRDHDVFKYSETFDNWKKTTRQMLKDFYRRGVQAKEELDEKLKKQRELKENQ